MRRVTIAASLVALAALRAPAAAQTVPDLYQRLKAEVHARAWSGALRTLGTLKVEADRPDNEKYREQLQAPIAFYRGVCEANLGQTEQAVGSFVEFLQIQPDSAIDASVRPHRVLTS